MSETKSSDPLQTLEELIKDIPVAMLTTLAPDGALRSRPMATLQSDAEGDLWFFTAIASGKVEEVTEDAHVNLSYVDASRHRYVSVSGRARVLRDERRIRELWKPALKSWFPKGPEDPNLALLQVRIQGAEYWDGPSNSMVLLAGMLKAMVTGKPYDGGEHEKLRVAP